MTDKLRIIVSGGHGRMGQETIRALNETDDLMVIGKTGREDDLGEMIDHLHPHIVVDFTTPDTVFKHTQIILEKGVHPVIGTTGLTKPEFLRLQDMAKVRGIGGIIAPNFSIAAILMMRCAATVAAYLSDVEIIEMHHDKKRDAPSGTALKTADLIAKNRPEKTPSKQPATSLLSRGEQRSGVPIHAIRLPGLLAHQQVIFGSEGETLTIKHDAIHRGCYMPGVLLACRRVVHLTELIEGIDALLD